MQISQDTKHIIELLKEQDTIFIIYNKDWREPIISFITDNNLTNSVDTFAIDNEKDILTALENPKYKYAVLFISELKSYNLTGDQPDGLDKHSYYSKLNFITKFQKGLYFYNLYEIKH